MRTAATITVVSTAFVLTGLLTACGQGPTGPTRNHLPLGGTVTVTPIGVGMAEVTTFLFDSNASDQDNDTLTYSWNFGDGDTGTGKTPTHVYVASGTFNVMLSVSDGKETVSAAGISVSVAPSITGTWTGGRNPFFPSSCEFTFTATQDGRALTGSIGFSNSCGTPSVTLASGSVDPLTHPSTVTWTSNATRVVLGAVVYENLSLRFTGTTNAAGNRILGTSQVLLNGVSGPRPLVSTTFIR